MSVPEEAVVYLRQTELLSGLDDVTLTTIAARLKKGAYPAGAVIVKEGEPGDALFLIISGLVEVKKREPSIGADLTLAKIGKGACFGEMSLLSGKPRSATVVAAEPTEVYLLGGKDFESLLLASPSMSLSLNRMFAGRIEEMNLNKGLNVVSPTRLSLDREIVGLMPEQFLLRHRVLPLGYSAGTLTLAMVNPADILVLDEVRKFVKHVPIEPVLMTAEDFSFFMKDGYRKVMEGGGSSKASGIGISTDGTEAGRLDSVKDIHSPDKSEEVSTMVDLEKEAAGAPIVRLSSNIIARALKKGASDIHLEPVEEGLRVRFRVDGLLSEEEVLPKKFQMPLTSRFKIISGIDITERRFPQDGRISMRLQERMVDFRVSTIPTKHGEKIVVRILTKESILGLDRLITDGRTLELVREMIRKPYGIIYVTGPTGSGKTTTLYSALSELHRPEVNILTAEDPIEYELAGAAQVQIHTDIGLDFARVLRSFLRQDPDIILVGETRDKESAAIAVQAALTGHLVFTTLHTNDASSTFIRLMEMDIQPLLISTSLIGVVAQRLVRRVCPECREEYIPDGTVAQYLGLSRGVPVFRGRGCPHCNMTGYRGRVGIFEVLRASEEIKHLIAQGTSTEEIRRAAIAGGMRTLKDYSATLLRDGLTSVDEVLRTVVLDS
ncbi:MAG TPA: ATPase, T2SS/T4P/T4SS family [Syntrophorhabdales bacterium]|nr:ATPase, T2SS/T4P/T4SS family [Syntrophorhabdales bacterium]